MEIYIVLGELDKYHYSSEKETFNTFDSEESALSHSVDMAKGDVTKGGTGEKYKLEKIIKFNTNNCKAKEMELVLSKGQFKLVEVDKVVSNQFDM